MPLYTVLVTVKLSAESQHEAYSDIRLALDRSRRAEIVHVDSEVIEEQPDEDEEPTARELQAAYKRVSASVQGVAARG